MGEDGIGIFTEFWDNLGDGMYAGFVTFHREYNGDCGMGDLCSIS